jgi:hypothetical protein
MEQQRTFSICDRRGRRVLDYKYLIDRVAILIVFAICLILLIHIISFILIYRKISLITTEVVQPTTVSSSLLWNLTSPLEKTLNCSNGRKFPLDLKGSRVSKYFLFLCKTDNSVGRPTAVTHPYQKLIILNSSRLIQDAASYTWTELDFMREFCLYCVHSVGYCKQMLKLKFYTNPDSFDCYYSYVVSNVFVCLNQNQEVIRGVLGGDVAFHLSRRELFQFCDIIEHWF